MSSALRIRLSEELKQSLQARAEVKTATVRLILAALKDRDISARSKGNNEGISDDDILSLLQTMIKQRNESVKMYQEGGRPELAAREQAEIGVIEDFLPRQLSESEIEKIVRETIEKSEATTVKDMGRVMALLKAEYAGQMDFSKASLCVKKELL